MSSVNKITAERSQRQLLELVNQPGNDVCADCKARAPRWASYNIGIFICMNCASIHRKIGTHITKVKSLTLDSWTKEQVEHMKQVGNVKSNAIYNPDEIRHRPPTNFIESERDSELEKFIRAKYEYKSYMPRSAITSSGPSSLSSSSSIDRSAAVAALLGPSRSASSRLSRSSTTRRETAPPSSGHFSSLSTTQPPLLPPRPQPASSTPQSASSAAFGATPASIPQSSTSQPVAAFTPPPQFQKQTPALNTLQTTTPSRTIDATLPLQVLAQPATQPMAVPMTSTPFTTTNPYSNLSANSMNPFPSAMGQATAVSPNGLGRSMSLNTGLSGNMGAGMLPFQSSPLNPPMPLNNPAPNPFVSQMLGSANNMNGVGLGIAPSFTPTGVYPQTQTPFSAPSASPFFAQQPLQPTQLQPTQMFSPQPQMQPAVTNPYLQSQNPGTPFMTPQYGGTPSPFAPAQPLPQTQPIQPMQQMQQMPQQGFGGANPFTSWIQQPPGQQGSGGYPWGGGM